jgi:hypothetical protein
LSFLAQPERQFTVQPLGWFADGYDFAVLMSAHPDAPLTLAEILSDKGTISAAEHAKIQSSATPSLAAPSAPAAQPIDAATAFMAQSLLRWR